MEFIYANDLQDMNLPEPPSVIEGIVPEGYTVMSAPRKIGKSWLANQMCYAVATGGTVLGRQATKGTAIYVTLEETMQMTASRQRKTWGERPAPKNLIYVHRCRGIEDGFVEELDSFIKGQGIEDVKLVVIDVLALIDGSIQKGEDAYHKDYRIGSTLKEWTKDKHVGLVAITHTSKKKSEDVYDDTMGTGGVTGSADAIITIRKKSGRTATMSVIGRSLPESDIDMRLDNCVWVTEAPDFQLSPLYDAVVDMAKNKPKERVTVTYITNTYGIDMTSKSVGTYLATNIDAFKKQGIHVEKKPNGTGAHSYMFWRIDDEQG